MTGILEGLSVVEGSAFIAAPSGGMTLASLGAEVIRFDNIGGGIDYRRWPVTEAGHSIYWADLNKGKQSIAVNLSHPEGRELLTELITRPGENNGLFLTNFPPRGFIDYVTLKSRRDDLIQITVQGDRHGGTALDYTVNAKVGFPYLTGQDPDVPINHVLPAWDLLCGQQAALGMLAAERFRTRTGQGQHVKLSLADVAYATVANLGYVGEKHVTGESRGTHGNKLFGAFGRDFTSSDNVRFMVVAITLRQWESLVSATKLEQPLSALAARLELDFRNEANRFRAHDDIAAILESWFLKTRYDDIQTALDKEKVCWGRYQTIDELVQNDVECGIDNPMFNIVDQPDIGSYPAPGIPLDFSAVARVPAAPAPRLGQHTDQILAEKLSLADSAIGKLHDAGIVHNP